MLQIKINGDKIINGILENGSIQLDGETQNFDLVVIGKNDFHIIQNNISYRAEIIELDWEKKAMTVNINGFTFQLHLKDQNDQLIEKLGLSTVVVGNVSEIKAPMPGLILSLHIVEGQEVEQGETLIILEAMKMENSIKAPSKATVKSIHTKAGESVEKNQVLVRF